MAMQAAQAMILPGAAAQQAADLREAQTNTRHLYWMQRMLIYGIYGLLVMALGGFVWVDTNAGRAAEEARKDRVRLEQEARKERARLEAKIDRLLRESDP